MALWRLYYHLVWATKERHPLIAEDLETELYGYMIGKADALGCIVHAIGGTDNHVHLVLSIPPRLAIADVVKGLKGSSAHHLNQILVRSGFTFGWQRGYGVFSLGQSQLDQAVTYVRNQKSHHQQGTVIKSLESDNFADDGPAIWHDGEAIAGLRSTEP